MNLREGTTGKQILLYVALAFIWPLLFALLMVNTSPFRTGVFRFLAFGAEAAAPSIAAVLTVLLFENANGLRRFLKESYITHFNLKVVLAALLLPMAVVGAPKLIFSLSSGQGPVWEMPSADKMIVICWALVAEELGWRGFLQRKLLGRVNEMAVPLIVGLIWAAWHYHYYLTGAMSAHVPLFILGCVTDSYIYYALTKRGGGNIVAASVFHFSENLCIHLFRINPEYNNGSITPYLLYGLASLAAATIAAATAYKRRRN